MIPKTAMVLATAIVLGSTLTVNAYIADVNTGLPTEIYYGPVCEHARQGLPVRERLEKNPGARPELLPIQQCRLIADPLCDSSKIVPRLRRRLSMTSTHLGDRRPVRCPWFGG
jgi:hypothetical protein